MSSKTKCFSYEGGCGIHILRQSKEVLAWTMNKYFQFSNNIMLLRVALKVITESHTITLCVICSLSLVIV